MKHLHPCAICREPVARPATPCPRCVAPDASTLTRDEIPPRTLTLTIAAIAVVMAAYNLANWGI